MSTIPGLIPADSWPVVPRAMHGEALRQLRESQAESARLRARVAELENRPLVAVTAATDDELQAENASLRAENAKLKRRLEAIRELMRERGVLS